MKIPQEVIDKDHELEARTGRATEALAKHRWHNTLDPKGPKYGLREYARAVGRHVRTIGASAHGYGKYLEGVASGRDTSLQDVIAQERSRVDEQALVEAIADGSGQPIKRVAHPEQRHARAVIIDQAKERAERRGTDPVDEARDIAKRHRQTLDMQASHKKDKAAKHTLRYVEMEGSLVKAKRALLAAISAGSGVDFDSEEAELIRHSLADIQAVLHLLDTRMAGTPDIDWDEELARLSEGT